MADRVQEFLASADKSPTRAITLYLGLAFAWCLFLYMMSLKGPFIFDDIPNIERNVQIRVESWTLESLRAVFADSLQSRRPVVNLTFAVNYYLHEYDVLGYRIFNIALHVVNSLLVYLLALSTLRTPALAARYQKVGVVALSAAALFLVHPVAIQSVAYVVQRMTSLGAFFYLVSLLCYVRWRSGNSSHPGWLVAAGLLAALLAFGSKEFTATLPLIVVFYELFFFRDLKLPPLRLALGSLLLALGVLALVSYVFLDGLTLERLVSGYAERDFTLVERLLTETRIVVYYLSLFVFPYPGRLNLDYDFPLSTSLLEPVTTALSLCLLAGLLVSTLLLSRRYRLPCFAILWFLVNLVIESSVIPLELIYEHRTYLPFVFLFIAFAAAVVGRHTAQRIGESIVLSLFVVFSLWTFQRAAAWGDAVSLWSDVAEKSPEKARPHNNLGAVLRETGRDVEAIPQFEKAIALDPNYANPYQSLGDIYYRMGDPRRAVGPFQEYVRLVPDSADGHKNLAVALEDVHRVNEAVKHYEKAIRLDPRSIDARHYLAVLLFNQGRPPQRSIQLLEEAISLAPDSIELRMSLVAILQRAGKREQVMDQLNRVLQLDPGRRDALDLLRNLSH